MSAKWSALPGASNVANADILAIVQGLVNKRINRPLLLAANPGESIFLGWTSGQLGFDTLGNMLLQFVPAKTFTLTDGTLNFVAINTIGTIDISAQPAGDVNISSALAFIQLSAAGHVGISDGSGVSADVTYVPTTPGDWMGSPPDQATAIDRIAAAIVARTIGGAIP